MKRVSINNKLLLFITGIISVVGLSTLFIQHTNAAACASGAYGTVTKTFSVPQTGNFRVWVRMQAASASNNAVKVELNGNTCFTAGNSSSISTTNWTWVNYQNGNTSNLMNYNFTKLNNSLKIIGFEPNVKVDKVIFVPSPEGDGCVPSNTRTSTSEPGDNCGTVGTPDPPPAPKILSFVPNPTSVVAGNKTTFSWSTTSTASCSVNPNGPQDTALFAWTTPKLTTVGTKTYTLDCRNSANVHTAKTASVNVTAATTPPQKPVFTADKTAVQKGGSVTFSWSSVGATACTFNPGNITSASSGTNKVENLTATTTYSLSCSNAAGSTGATPITITVTDTPPPVQDPVIVLLKADPTNVVSGGTSTISWQTTGVIAGGCRLTPSPSSSAEPNASYITPALTASKSYTLSCVNSNGKSTSKSVSVTVNGTQPAPNPKPVTPKPSSTNNSTKPVITNPTTGVDVANVAANDTVSGLATLDAGNISDPEQEANIDRVEYYIGEELIQTVTEPPFALDTTLLVNGTYTITQRTYFKDGSQSEVTKVLSVQNEEPITSEDTGSSIGVVLTILGILAILGIVAAIIFRKKWTPYVGPFFDRFNKSDDYTNYQDVDATTSMQPPEHDEFSDPTVIQPEKKDK